MEVNEGTTIVDPTPILHPTTHSSCRKTSMVNYNGDWAFVVVNSC